jgi:putative PIN family toxin of toxin-antitoxin system
LRILTDTNVLVSALATRGLSADLLQIIIAEHELLCAEVVLVELERILTRKLKVPQPAVDQQISALRRYTTIPAPHDPSPYLVREPDDSFVLASALLGQADVLVTGDKDLLSIKDEVRELAIMDPRALWQLLRGSP